MRQFTRSIHVAALGIAIWSAEAGAQVVLPDDPKPSAAAPAASPAPGAGPTADSNGGRQVLPAASYVIGPDDVLSVVFWRDPDMTKDVVVRPDGKISLPLINDLQAAGMSPDQLRESITKAASRLYADEPTVSVVVKQINSRKVFIMGSVSKPGTYPIAGPLTVAQLIATAGGLLEYADKQKISVISLDKRPDGTPWRYKFNYAEFLKGINLKQNIELKPGDTVIVP